MVVVLVVEVEVVVLELVPPWPQPITRPTKINSPKKKTDSRFIRNDYTAKPNLAQVLA